MIATLLVPGLLGTAEVFTPQIPLFWRYGPVTLVSTSGGNTVEEMASAILKAAPPAFALVGLSMGGYICLEIMRQAADRVSRLALLDTSARPDTPEQSRRRRDLVEKARGSDFTRFVEVLFTNALHPANRANADLEVINRSMASCVSFSDFERNTEAAISRRDFREGLNAIQVPTAVLVGDCDLITPPDHAKEIVDGIPGARLTTVPQSGHIPTLERSDVVNKTLEYWLSS